VQEWKLEPARDLGMPLGQRLRSYVRECGLIETAAHLVWWSLVRTYMRLAHRLTVDGRENIPRKAPFVMVANHSSHLDALVLACRLPWYLRDRVFPVAAGDVFFESKAMTVFAAGFLNALPMWRRRVGPRAMEQLRRRLLEEPCAYILFPEGTRTRDGRMNRFKPGLGMLVAGTEVPVVPCFIDGAHRALPPDRKLPRFSKIRLRIGPPLVFASVPNIRDGWDQIAKRTEAAVAALA
jgi:1-acyl-sn-glycerol-3-phosphate acyltransferase